MQWNLHTLKASENKINRSVLYLRMTLQLSWHLHILSTGYLEGTTLTISCARKGEVFVNSVRNIQGICQKCLRYFLKISIKMPKNRLSVATVFWGLYVYFPVNVYYSTSRKHHNQWGCSRCKHNIYWRRLPWTNIKCM